MGKEESSWLQDFWLSNRKDGVAIFTDWRKLREGRVCRGLSSGSSRCLLISKWQFPVSSWISKSERSELQMHIWESSAYAQYLGPCSQMRSPRCEMELEVGRGGRAEPQSTPMSRGGRDEEDPKRRPRGSGPWGRWRIIYLVPWEQNDKCSKKEDLVICVKNFQWVS